MQSIQIFLFILSDVSMTINLPPLFKAKLSSCADTKAFGGQSML